MEKSVGIITVNSFSSDVRIIKEATYLKKLGYQIEIISLDRKGTFVNDFDEYEGIAIRRYNPHTNFTDKISLIKGLKKIVYIFWYIKYILFVRKYVSKRYNYLHCMGLFETIIGVYSNILNNKKVIFDMRELYSGTTTSKVFNWIIDKILKVIICKSNYIIYLNDAQLRYRKRSESKWVYLPNYPDVSHFKDIKKIKSEYLRLNYAGTVRDYDSFKMLIEAVKGNEDVEVNIYGIGGILDSLKELSKENKNVYIHGKYDGVKESEYIYKVTDVVYSVYSPNRENWSTGLPVKLFESLWTETPMIAIIGTAFGNFVEMNNVGFTFDYTIKGLKSLIKEIKNSDLLEEKRSNIRKIKSNFTWEQVVSNLELIYKGD